MTDLRNVYAQKAISQIPRILGNEDRNPFSPTYGCFDRTFWLDKAIDFPSAIMQFSVHSLALVYKHAFPENIYFGQPKIRDWCFAGMDYWTKIQHRDGSFDEFYPFERGWAGPTAFTLYAMLDSYEMLRDEIPKDLEERVLKACYKAAMYLSKYDEAGVLANHHAIATLAVRKAYEILGEKTLLQGFQRKWHDFRKYHTDEGWSLEYDGADPGYLSATVSFLGKLYKICPSEELLNVLSSAIEFTSYFVYPNKFYAGSLGSRQTLHFYPHGFEIMSKEIPLAGAIAQKMLEGLQEGKLVPPEIMADRYLAYRVAEFLLSSLDYQPRASELPELPFERAPFKKYFPKARIFISKIPGAYVGINLAKGGVVKVFSLGSGKLIYNDCGLIGLSKEGKILSSQWIDKSYQVSISDESIVVEGNLNQIPSMKVFSPIKMVLFRLALLAIGWSTKLCYLMKGAIRKMLVVGNRAASVRFRRTIEFAEKSIKITDLIRLEGQVKLQSLAIGDEFAVRYVPQSFYFQTQELDVDGFKLTDNMLNKLNNTKQLQLARIIDVVSGKIEIEES